MPKFDYKPKLNPMKKSFFILFIFISPYIKSFSQNEVIDSLVKIKEQLKNELTELETAVKKKEMEIKTVDIEITTHRFAILEKSSIPIFKVKSRTSCTVRNKPTVEGNKVKSIPRETEIMVSGYENEYWGVLENGQIIGYVIGSFIKGDQEFEEYAKARKEAELARIRKEREAKKKRESQVRLDNLIKKYGVVNGKRLLESKVWIGMTKEMALESWGKPEDINVTITNYGRDEQWVYGSGQYLYFDDGILTTIQK